jgi:hypothetical protein
MVWANCYHPICIYKKVNILLDTINWVSIV